MTATTEGILVSPDGFNLTTATPCQRARCRIGDGLPLDELRTHPDVIAMCGGETAVAALPSERGIAPRKLVDLSSIRSAKTLIALARAIRASQVIDVSGLKVGEVPRIPILNLRLDRARSSFRVLSETVQHSKLLRPLLIEVKADSLLLRHPTGRPVSIEPVAGSKAGANLIGDWLGGLLGDEAPRMAGSEDGTVVNLTDALAACEGRMLDGSAIVLLGSAWAPFGPVYDLVQEHWCKPSAQVVVLRSTGPQNNPRHWTSERCAALEASNPVAYRTDVLGEFADPEQGLLSPIAVRQNTRAAPLELPFEQGARYAAAIDPSEGTVGGNGFALVILKVTDRSDPDKPRDPSVVHFSVALAREYRGQGPDAILQAIAADCRKYGVKRARTDQYSAAAISALARRHGLTLYVEPTTGPVKLEMFTNMATIIHEGRLELSPDPTLIRDLLSIKRRTTQSGVSIVLPSMGGRHADFGPALASCLRETGRVGNGKLTMLEALTIAARRGEPNSREKMWAAAGLEPEVT